MNLTYPFWERLRKLVLGKTAKKSRKADVDPPPLAPSFQCTSCRHSITHPLRIHINICPFCNATVVPVSYMQADAQLAEYQLGKLKMVVRDYLKAGILTLDDLKAEKHNWTKS